MLEISLPLGLVEPLGCLPASPQEASRHLAPWKFSRINFFQISPEVTNSTHCSHKHAAFSIGTALQLWKPDPFLSTRPHASDSL